MKPSIYVILKRARLHLQSVVKVKIFGFESDFAGFRGFRIRQIPGHRVELRNDFE